MNNKKIEKMFVFDVVSNNKLIKHVEELNIIAAIKDKLLHIILMDNTEEAKRQCRNIINEITNGQPLKGNIHYFVETANDKTLNIEIVRAAHGGGSNSAVRTNGGIVIATLVITDIKGELSPIHGYTWYNLEERDPFSHI